MDSRWSYFLSVGCVPSFQSSMEKGKSDFKEESLNKPWLSQAIKVNTANRRYTILMSDTLDMMHCEDL